MRWFLLAALIAGCGSSSDATIDAATTDASIDASSTDKASACASTFGQTLTNAFGRLDGTVLAVVPPAHPTCAQPNSTHLVLQVTMQGAAYRLVVNVQSVFLHELDAPLAGAAWAEGWHPGEQLDYVSTLHVNSTQFVQHTMAETVALTTDQITIGSKISVYSTSSGGTKADSAHLIHRNAANADGAIVIDPASATPHYLMFRFSNQTF